jgi:SMC interacting uncharacterized protein involved in chromosome segregation
MKKPTDEELKKEIDEIEKEILEDLKIDEVTKALVKKIRETSRDLTKYLEIKNFIKKSNEEKE